MSHLLLYCFNVYQIKLGEERQAESSEREVSDEQVGTKKNIDMISLSLFLSQNTPLWFLTINRIQ